MLAEHGEKADAGLLRLEIALDLEPGHLPALQDLLFPHHRRRCSRRSRPPRRRRTRCSGPGPRPWPSGNRRARGAGRNRSFRLYHLRKGQRDIGLLSPRSRPWYLLRAVPPGRVPARAGRGCRPRWPRGWTFPVFSRVTPETDQTNPPDAGSRSGEMTCTGFPDSSRAYRPLAGMPLADGHGQDIRRGCPGRERPGPPRRRAAERSLEDVPFLDPLSAAPFPG